MTSSASSRVIVGSTVANRRASIVLPKTDDIGHGARVDANIFEHVVTLEIQQPRAETQAAWVNRVTSTSAPMCACGCGNVITIRGRHRSMGLPKYVHGHHPNPIRRVHAALRDGGYVLLGEACKQLGISGTTFRRLEAASVIPRMRRLEVWGGRSVRVLTASDIDRVARAVARWKAGRRS